MSDDIGELARLLLDKTDTSSKVELRQAVVASLSSATGTIGIYLSGNAIYPVTGVRYMANYVPVVADVVWLIKNGPDLLVLGRINQNDKYPAYSARMFLNASPPIIGVGYTKILGTWGAFYDPNSCLDLTNRRYIAKHEGLYHASASMTALLNNALQGWGIAIFNQAGGVLEGEYATTRGGSGSDPFRLHVSGDIYMEVGDYLEVWMYNTGPNNVQTSVSSTGSYLSVHKVV